MKSSSAQYWRRALIATFVGWPVTPLPRTDSGWCETLGAGGAHNPDWQKRQWLKQFGLAYLVTTDIDQVTKEAEQLLEQVARDFADVPIADRRYGNTLGELANGHLHEIRYLSPGKPAPELNSVDLNGKPVRLADLKGKIVVLDVWATWCGACRAMIPHQRELVKRLKEKPFALVA